MKNRREYARRLFLAGHVEMTAWSAPFIYFTVKKKYEFRFNTETFKFSLCTCAYGSYYGQQEILKGEKYCIHQMAAREFLIQRQKDNQVTK